MSLGGDYRGVPAVVWDGGRIDLLVTDATGSVYQRSRTLGGHFGPWTKAAGTP